MITTIIITIIITNASAGRAISIARISAWGGGGGGGGIEGGGREGGMNDGGREIGY